jgi:hemerythrin-like domain-containing protein
MTAANIPSPIGTDFSVLDACHQQITEHLARLDGLVEHLDRLGVDARAQDEARAVEAFFSQTSRRHHQDEEAKVFPGLLASSDETLVSTVHMLQQDHGWIEEDWHEIAPQLRAIASGCSGYDPAELRHAVQVFLELCHEHIQLEESVIYPRAKALAARLKRGRAQHGPVRFTKAAPSSS